MSSYDHDVYAQIGEILINVAPHGSKKAIVTFTIDAEETVSEGAVHDFKYDYIDQSGERKWFKVSGPDGHWKIGDLFVSLRKFLSSQGQPNWTQCEFALDLITGSFSVNFKFD